ncbi:MAG: DNA polymerase III subunit alpha, partial [Muribaculaceae bacterium]|nr:DNA polymerase III subunit alpha [Muribaculaceae bacterium]
CKTMHIPVKGPDVNESFGSFGVNTHGDIRFGIAAIKGVGENVAADIIEARKAGGPFKSIYDFVERVPLTSLNRRTFESLAIAGAFDCFTELKREDFFEKNYRDESLSELLLRYGQLYQNAQREQTTSLFGEDDFELNTAGRPPIKPALEWPAAVRLEKEREIVGMYLSANPLDPYYMELNYGCNSSIKEIVEGTKEENRLYTFGGMVTSFETRPSRKGGNYGRMMIEDYTGSTEIMLFNKDYIQFANYGKPSAQLIIAGKYERSYNNELRFKIQTIKLLDEVKGHLISGVTVKVTPDEITDSLIDLFREASMRETSNRGTLTIEVYDPNINRTVKMLSGLKVPIDRDLVDMLDGLGLKYDFTRTVN